MRVVTSINGVPIRLTAERLSRIERRHPEMQGEEARMLESVAMPDLVQLGDNGTLLGIKHYARTPLGEKYCVVVYKETSQEDSFVLTAYFAGCPNERRNVVWKR